MQTNNTLGCCTDVEIEGDIRDWAVERMVYLWNPRSTPQQLLHFTTSKAKSAIVQSGVIRATRLFDQWPKSDRMEWRLGWGALRTVIAGVADSRDTDVGKGVLQRFEEDKGPFADLYAAHVACFTEAGELATTQSYFERMGLDAALRFDVENDLSSMLQAGRDRKLGVRLLPVVYDLDYLVDVAEDVADKVIAHQEKWLTDNPQAKAQNAANRAFYALRTPFTMMGLSFKRPRYRTEAEWRIIVTTINDHNPEADHDFIELDYRNGTL